MQEKKQKNILFTLIVCKSVQSHELFCIFAYEYEDWKCGIWPPSCVPRSYGGRNGYRFPAAV